MSRLGDLIDRELGRAAEEVEVREETVDFGQLAGPEHSAERIEFAEMLSGHAPKSTRAYKAAKRNVERWAKGRKPVKISIERIVDVQRRNSRRVRRIAGSGANVRFKIAWYSERKPEWLPPHRWQELTSSVMKPIVEAWQGGFADTAGAGLWAAFLTAYNVPNLEDWIRDVEVIDLKMEPR